MIIGKLCIKAMLEIKYRPALKSDIKFLLNLRLQTMNPHLIASSLPICEEAHLQRIEYKFEHAKIIEINDCAIGLLKCHRQTKKIELIQIQLAQSFQGKGIGKRILKELIKEAIESEKTITLSVLKTNQAKNLYLCMGFKIVGETGNSYLMSFEN
ncbi:GNAT family N-acetyltransferase [Sphingobacterium sp.]|uniref:GNAT family N-acetyltransferase n=1 Tax=Sphingobacterium sp. TaxID=341027 RepID=UPI00289AC37A|nr:GNAT family N-acetyltransferase [Sphingobacterium sp.]